MRVRHRFSSSPSAGVIACLLAFCGAPVAAFESPFPPARGSIAASRGEAACGATPTPVIALRTVSKYRQDDPTKSQIDASAQVAFERAMEPVREVARRVTKAANAHRASGAKDEAAALCALHDLEAWSAAGALTQIQNDKAYDTQGKTLAALALGYLQLRDATIDRAARQRITTWLAAMADDLRRYVGASSGKSARNNHRYWSGLGVAAAGVAADRGDLFDWGIESARIGLRQVASDGTLPLELERAERARDYHLYALAPLVLLAELAATNGSDLYAENDRALQRLAARVLSSLDDPAYFQERTGTPQIDYPGRRGVPPYRLAWLEPFNARFPSTLGTALLAEKRPVVETGLGGNLTTIYRISRH